MNRPFGVSLLAILTLFGGLLYLAAALGFFGLALLPSEDEVIVRLGSGAPDWIVESFFLVFLILGLFASVIAVAFFAATRGLLQGRSWAWTLAVVVTLLSLVSSLLSVYTYGFSDPVTSMGTVFGLILVLLILAYLFTGRVRRFFGKS
ncbi:MAG: hypothetical protein JW880_02365 [Candidatus Thermoplasmatota archaeon]|nr:hypothetical protein [Candidatus Thermoplasmatota archaeon]